MQLPKVAVLNQFAHAQDTAKMIVVAMAVEAIEAVEAAEATDHYVVVYLYRIQQARTTVQLISLPLIFRGPILSRNRTHQHQHSKKENATTATNW